MPLQLLVAGALAYSPGAPVGRAGAAASAPARFARVVAIATLERDLAAVQPTTMSRFRRLFCGHFDNLAQVDADAAAGRAPREGGGHEHIHCHLQPLAMRQTRTFAEPVTEYVLASYYFNGQPDRIFRERVYALTPLDDDRQFGRCVQMQILRLRPQTEAALRAAGGDASFVAWDPAHDADAELRIPDCDVFWRWLGERFEGEMRTESIVVHSPVLKQDIVVRDDVALWEGDAADGQGDALWCNDRGSDMEGKYVYGNIHNVPYKMQRVASDHWTARGDRTPERR